MTFHEAKLSLQLASEERAGFVMRERVRMAKAAEDAAWQAAVGASDGTG